ncbi:MAG: hypothetical protein ACXVJU_17085 [Candidatus Angelobacter sp.]
MAVVVVLTGICVAGVLFLLRFLIALCQERAPGDAAHLLRVTPAPVGADEPDDGETTEPSSEADHRSVHKRMVNRRPAANTRRAAPVESRRVERGNSQQNTATAGIVWWRGPEGKLW